MITKLEQKLENIFGFFLVNVKKLLTVLNKRDKQSCKVCGKNQYIIWIISDEIWNKVGFSSDKTICLECFTKLAVEKEIWLKITDFDFIKFQNYKD